MSAVITNFPSKVNSNDGGEVGGEVGKGVGGF